MTRSSGSRARRAPYWLTLAGILLVLLTVAQARALPAAAHAELVRADPPPDGLLAVPPRAIDLWLSESVAEGEGSPSIEVIDQQGREVAVGAAKVDPGDPTHVSASVSGITTGTYTVLWSVRSAVDGHTLTGSYAVRVGAGRAPGAASVEGETPRAWAVATRWLTLLGAGAAAGAFGLLFLLRGLVGNSPTELFQTRAGRIAALGFGVALVASLIEPLLASAFPPRGVVAPAMSEAIAGLPTAWWLRPLAALGGLALVAVGRGRVRWAPVLGLAPALGIVLGLSLTSHAAARSTWREAATAVNLVHLATVALWIGGLVVLALGWTAFAGHTAERTRLLRRFSQIALPLVLVSLLTGAGNAGFVLPRLDALWSSDYGALLLVKIGLIALPLVLAARHRMALRRVATEPGSPFVRSLRLETVLVAAVLAFGVTLALLAPPRTEAERPQEIEIAQPVYQVAGGQNLLVKLAISPAKSGPNRWRVSLANADRTPYTGTQPARAALALRSLEFPAAMPEQALAPQPDGSFLLEESTAGLDGWWGAEVTLRWLGEEDVTAAYYLLLPDPNAHGLDAPKSPAPDPAGAALYDRGMAMLTGLHTVRYWQSMADNRGNVAHAEHLVNDGADGRRAPGYIYRAPYRYEAIVIGTTYWSRNAGEAWEVGETGPMIPPSEWDEEYAGATGFRLGNIEEIDGERCQIVSFVVPGNDRQVISWYVWWVGLETGYVRRDVMVSRSHYMTNDFVAFDSPIPLDPPADAPPAPAASPAP